LNTSYHNFAIFICQFAQYKLQIDKDKTVPSNYLLTKEANEFVELRRRLIEADPEIDETTLLDTLEGATDLKEALGEVIRSALDDEAMLSGLKGRLDDLKVRLDRIRHRIDKKREVALAVMEETGVERLCEPDFTVSLRVSPPGVVITSEDDIPEWFWIPQAPKLDKRAILDAIKAGTAVSGAQLSNSKISIAVRTK
jgi:hypothetical protein